ncbi:MAG TPA: hypothetical protein VHB02_06245 [Acidimicrobiales bacterium]|nr:hypothetical protein [Acidimicrobiales bacterium]
MEVPARPYSKIKGTEPSVTTILHLLPKPGLPWAAARETALFAVLHQDRWTHLDDEKAVDILRKHHRGIWDGRMAMGTLCHKVNELYCDGETVDLEALINATIAQDRNARMWAEQNRDDLVDQCLGYVLGLEKWWEDFDPDVLAAEVVVRYPGKYIGQTDLRVRIDDQHWLLDIKTTAKQDEGSGIYADSWTAQLNAYAFAPETVTYEAYVERERTKVREVSTGPWSPPDRIGVIHLRGDEGYSFFELGLSSEAHEVFLQMADVYRWLGTVAKEPPVVRPKGGA